MIFNIFKIEIFESHHFNDVFLTIIKNKTSKERFASLFLQILDYQQFYLNLTAANLEGKATWLLEYEFLDAFKLSNMSYESVDSLAQSFDLKENNDTFQKYYNYNSV